MSQATAPAKESATRRTIKNLRWWILAWALAAGILNYMDRSAISIAAPALMDELGLTRTDIGLLGTVFSWTYAFAQLPAGWLVDKLGARRMYFLAIAGWSIATGLMAVGSAMWQFVTFRFLLGVTEAPNGPASARLTADWFPRSERGQATAIWDSGSKWGPAIAPPILTGIMIAFGWHAIFVFLGVLGLVLAVAFFIFYRRPDLHPSISDDELALIRTEEQKQDTGAAKVPWLRLFAHRQIWGMMAGFFCVIWIWNIFIVFLPLYLQEERGVTIAGSGWLAAIPYLGAAVLGITGGWVMTRYTKRAGIDALTAKRRVMSVAAVVAGVLICLIPLVADLTLAMIVMTLALGFVATMQAAAWAMPGDIVNTSQVASVGAIQNFGGYFGGAFAPLLTGIIADATGSYAPSFFIGGIIAALAAVAYTVLVRRPMAAEIKES
jgi:MFS family permease